MTEFIKVMLGLHDFPARWFCGNWTSLHGWTHIIADTLVWAAYFTIPVILLYFLNKRKDVPFPKVFWLFAAFIFFCGVGHLMEAVIYWVPIYRVSGVNKVFTAITSWATVLVLIRIIPLVLAMKTSKEFEVEIERRQEVESELRNLANHLKEANLKLAEKHSSLREQTNIVERMNKAFLNREMKMIELKEKIVALEEKLKEHED